MEHEQRCDATDHLKVFVELLEELAIFGDAIVEGERVIILLSSLPDRFSTLVTALEAHEKIPAWEVVTERLLNEERRQRGGRGTSDFSEKLLVTQVLLSTCATSKVNFHLTLIYLLLRSLQKKLSVLLAPSLKKKKHEDSEGELELRRSTRNRAAPDRFGEWVCFAQDKFDVPANLEEALHGPESKLWKAAMEEEMASMNINNVWSLVERTKNKKPIWCKWIFKKKTGPDGNVCSCKARLVAQGYAQKFGVDYDETFSPVSLYGLKQSPKCWNTALDGHLKQLGFKQSKNDACIYTRVSNKGLCIIAVYVDDIIIASDCLDEINEVKSCLSAKYKMKDLGKLSYFLGVSVMQTKNEVFLEQSAYTKALLSRFDMDNANSVATPVDVTVDLVTTSDEVGECDKNLYQSAVGSLLY
ncbi:Reverse transcriptase RNA-dependent DNA polymerase [Trinorchestia longiramus]|nr:Reverse transcriptase RNA-dependent DNA polymerase [Trinorchestia longiramus]